ncbi:MAG: transcriptional regulator [Methylococcales bacterium]|nr:transcriptional regulator [Methylococcales bacterium]
MQLAITALGNNPTNFINKILDTVSSCDCQVLTLKSSCLNQAVACYLLVNGNWNQIAKLESTLTNLQILLNINIHSLRPDSTPKRSESIPYFLESISASPNNVIENMSSFLYERDVYIEDINARFFQASYNQTKVFSVKFILSIPIKLKIRSLREDLQDFSFKFNIDILFNPINQ